ncbi:MAG: DNA gyrase C-terminal beta-propeller domain-containing protein, partial [Nocardioidaceae bacterium]
LQGGAPITEFVALEQGERAVTLTSLAEDSFGLALGTTAGVVKRVQPDLLTNKEAWDVIRLDEGDEVIGGVELHHPDDELVFITSDAQLLHFPASVVRPQGRPGGGIAGVRTAAGARVISFGAIDPSDNNVVVTVAGSSDALPGTESGTVKVTPFSEYPGKGRGTGGVRCHRFLKGEDTLLVAFAGPAPAKAAAASGAPVDLPEEHGRRDGSGTMAAQPILAITGTLRR